MAHPQFQVSTGKDEKFYFNLTAANGQVILSSQGYKGNEQQSYREESDVQIK